MTLSAPKFEIPLAFGSCFFLSLSLSLSLVLLAGKKEREPKGGRVVFVPFHDRRNSAPSRLVLSMPLSNQRKNTNTSNVGFLTRPIYSTLSLPIITIGPFTCLSICVSFSFPFSSFLPHSVFFLSPRPVQHDEPNRHPSIPCSNRTQPLSYRNRSVDLFLLAFTAVKVSCLI